MSLITICFFDTEENGRTKYTRETLFSLANTVDFTKHRLFLVDNNSCKETKELLSNFTDTMNRLSNTQSVTLITNIENVGTAKAINQGWSNRTEDEHCIKIDNDVVINQDYWIEQLEEVIAKDDSIGQVGLKRKDLWEYPTHPDPHYRTTLEMLPHEKGEKYIIVEECKHIMGTCVLHSKDLINKVGGLYQPGFYGFDDALMSLRSNLAGFRNVFLPHINIDHIDIGGDAYTDFKAKYAGEQMEEFGKAKEEFISGKRKLYVEY